MTLIKPTLALQRLVVLKSGGALYDQTFHTGLNIIRGENSSGKTTIADFIFFSLGGDLRNWTPEAGGTDSVHTQVAINYATYTFSREVQADARPPIQLFEGTYDEAIAARDKWLKYPYSRSGNTESFSQVIFHLLGLPEQKADTQQNITLNQILRLLYFDQITSVEEIFRAERFDNRDIRTAIGELLLGIDDLAMHGLRLRLREAERRFAEVAGELRSMFRVLGQTEHANISVINYQQEVSEAEAEQEDLRRTVDALANRRNEEIIAKAEERIRGLYIVLQDTKRKISEHRHTEQSIAFDLEDSRKFVDTLKERLGSLSASEHMVSILGSIQFKICPACFQVTESTENGSVCHLCKSPVSDSEPWVGHLKMREELTFQLRESQNLIERREMELKETRSTLSDQVMDQRGYEAYPSPHLTIK